MSKIKNKYIETLEALREKLPGTAGYGEALENYQLAYWNASGEILKRNYSLLDYIARKHGVSSEESIDTIQVQLFEKISYYMDKVEDAEDSFYQLAQKAQWLLYDHYQKITAANRIRSNKKNKDKQSANSVVETGQLDSREKDTNEEEVNAWVWVSHLPFDTPAEDDEDLTFSEIIRDEKAIDPPTNYQFKELGNYLLKLILANRDKVTDTQLLCYLCFFCGMDNKQLIGFLSSTEDSGKIMDKISDFFSSYFGFTSKQLSELNLDIPKSLSQKNAANRLSEAKKVYNKILETDPFVDEYLREYHLRKYKLSEC